MGSQHDFDIKSQKIFEKILRCFKYLCYGGDVVILENYEASILNDNVQNIFNDCLLDFLKKNVTIFEIDGMSSDPFSLESIISVQSYDYKHLSDIPLLLEGRIIIVSEEFNFVIFSDFDDFQILLIDRSIVSNFQIESMAKNLFGLPMSFEAFEQQMADGIARIAKRIDEFNESI